ncbi:hypothetical protein [Colwellia psychrerythraea]|uniref:Uncharacterized protein n=1 Tax=Colwellia psychrerythraea TaxID=28229 RepID=A0A099KP54_COLPS|nr:hypothetical protein [Colwellia psychrerythraea]KGJ91423.1 hypothetical protein ND2E_3288 [Colwellia psychrerythraea]
MQVTAKVTEITVMSATDRAAIESFLSGAGIIVLAIVFIYCLYRWKNSNRKDRPLN